VAPQVAQSAPVPPTVVTTPQMPAPPVVTQSPPADATPLRMQPPAAAEPLTAVTQVPPAVPPVALVQPPVAAVPQPTARPADPGDAIRVELAAFVAQLPCSMFGGDVRNGAVEISGIGGKSAIDGLRQKLIAMGVSWPVPSSRLTQTDPVFCSWEDVLRPVAKNFGDHGVPLSLHIAGNPEWLKKDDYIRPRVVMADFRGEVRVDYLDRQGNVLHMYPPSGDQKQPVGAGTARSFQPGEALDLGDPGPKSPGWQVDEPYGTDVIVAVQSEVPLFDQPRPRTIEKAADYLRDLKVAIEAARSRGARIAAAAIPLETRLK